MKKRFTQLIFQTSKQRNKSEMVYSGCIQPSSMVENTPFADEVSTETSDDVEEPEQFLPDKVYRAGTTLHEIYNVAFH